MVVAAVEGAADDEGVAGWEAHEHDPKQQEEEETQQPHLDVDGRGPPSRSAAATAAAAPPVASPDHIEVRQTTRGFQAS